MSKTKQKPRPNYHIQCRAGLLIFALSGSELTKLEGASTDTIETLGGDLEQFLDETNSVSIFRGNISETI